jgi:polyisoprenyl-phosphate glycosyltransferase
VVPCYNEEEFLEETTKRLTLVLEDMIKGDAISEESRVLFVDDGSKDKTWFLIEELHGKNHFIEGLKLSRNAGHQNALLAGLNYAKEKADCVVSIDADLQDDVNAIKEFIEKFHEGYEVVYGVRSKRKTDTFFKRFTAESFYKLMKKLGVDLVYNHADYRLLSKRALNELCQFKESNVFLRGLIPLLGFKNTQVFYERHERFAGESKYPLKKMLAFALNGITSFSIKPLRLITGIGITIALLSIVFAVYAIISKLMGQTVTGWTSLMVSLWFIGGVQLISIGLIGEYVGKIYKETKNRPLYIVEKGTENESV